MPFLASACGKKRPPCALCGKPFQEFGTYDQLYHDSQTMKINLFYAFTMPLCGDNACIRMYIKVRPHFMAVLGPLVTGHYESVPVSVKCLYCHVLKPTNELKKCSGCKIAVYCSPACQKEDWPLHKRACRREGNVIVESKKLTEKHTGLSID